MEDEDVLARIAEVRAQIEAVEEWNAGEREQMRWRLSAMQEELEREISIGEEFELKIQQRLDAISQIKAEIYRDVPDNNGFSVQ